MYASSGRVVARKLGSRLISVRRARPPSPRARCSAMPPSGHIWRSSSRSQLPAAVARRASTRSETASAASGGPSQPVYSPATSSRSGSPVPRKCNVRRQRSRWRTPSCRRYRGASPSGRWRWSSTSNSCNRPTARCCRHQRWIQRNSSMGGAGRLAAHSRRQVDSIASRSGGPGEQQLATAPPSAGGRTATQSGRRARASGGPGKLHPPARLSSRDQHRTWAGGLRSGFLSDRPRTAGVAMVDPGRRVRR